MTPDEVKKIIREELENVIKIDRYVFDRNIQILDARNIQIGRTTGTQIGTATDQKIGFYGETPVNQPDTVGDPSGGTTVDSQARSAINSIIDRLQELGLIA
jgi:hypothetical protein